MFHSLPFLFSSLAIALLAVLINRHRRLSSIPGPFLASTTDLWRFYITGRGEWPETLARLHATYGSLVRIGPNTVSVSDPTSVPTIYSMHGEFRKADSYHPLRALVNGKIIGSVIDLQDETEVSGLRRAVGNAFAAKNLLDYEADVDHTVERLLRAIRKARLVNGHAILQQFQVDFLMKAAFSRQTDYLETRRSTSAINGYSRLTHWSRWQSAPSLEWLFFKSPLCSAWYARRAAKPQAWTAMAIEEFNNRRNKKQPAAAAAGDDKPDLLAKFMSGGDRHRDTVSTETVLRMVSSTISAGFDSSAFTMMSILYMLLKNPPAKEKLQAELDDAVSAGRLSPPWPPRFTDVDRLPYLGAVIKESMRLSTFLVNSLEREVPAGGAEVAGAYLPTGTVVGVAIQIAHRDTGVFGKDADEFRPDRWLEADEKTRLLMERSVLSFGGGKRVCMGRHIAELEMKKVIPSLLLEFDISLQDPNYVLEPLDKLSNFPKPFNIVCQDKA